MGNKNHTTSTTTTTNSNESSHQVSSMGTTTSSAMPQEQQHFIRSPAVDDVTVDVDVSAAAQKPKVDSLIDQLADFKSFGASLMTSTTNSLAVVATGVASEPLTASAGSGSGS